MQPARVAGITPALLRYNLRMTQSKTRKFLGLAVLVLGVVLAGGGFWLSHAMAPDLALGSTAPSLSLTDVNGQPLALADLRGKVVLLDFWSST